MTKNQCSSSARRFAIRMEADQWELLKAWAERGFMTMPMLVEKIVLKWLIDGDKRLIELPIPEAKETPQETARLREKIVRGWWESRRWRGRGTTIEEASKRYLEVVRTTHGINLSRACLYNWESRYRQFGIDGLADRRRPRVSAHKPSRAG